MREIVINVEVTYSQPVVGPRVYLAKGPSGWPETFERKHADEALRAFAAPLEPLELVELFIAARELADDPKGKLTDWYTITGFLGRTMDTSPKAVPPAAAVAFWGQVLAAMPKK